MLNFSPAMCSVPLHQHFPQCVCSALCGCCLQFFNLFAPEIIFFLILAHPVYKMLNFSPAMCSVPLHQHFPQCLCGAICGCCLQFLNFLAPELFFFNFSTLCIENVNNTGTKYVRIMKQTSF